MAASLATSMAQNVYSLNVVGYVNVTLPSHQFYCVANPLDATLGGTVAGGNDITNLFSATTTAGLAGNSYFDVFLPALIDYAAPVTYSALSKKWASSYDMPPGKAVLFFNAGAADAVVTFTGQVEQGTYNVASMGSHQFSMLGSPVPIGGDITNSTTVLGLVPTGNDLLETFNGATIDWNAPSTWSALSKKWSATASSTINPGQGFLYFNANAAANNWVSNFTVN
jgi:hypothetical protein